MTTYQRGDAKTYGDGQLGRLKCDQPGKGTKNLDYGLTAIEWNNVVDAILDTRALVLAGGSTIQVQDEGIAIGTRTAINLIGTGVQAVDNPGAGRVDITVTAAVVTASAPANVTKAAAAVGVATDAARADHKHDITTAAPSTTGTANAEGSSSSLARADHVHQTRYAAQATFVVGNSVAGDTAADCDYLDTGNCAQLDAAVVAVNALSPPGSVFVRRGTYDRSLGGGPTVPTPIAAGVRVIGEGRECVTIRSRTSGDQGVFTLARESELSQLTIEVQEPTAATSGATAVVSAADATGPYGPRMEDVDIVLLNSLDATEAGNLTLRSAIKLGSANTVRGARLERVRISSTAVAPAGWQINQHLGGSTVFVGILLVSNLGVGFPAGVIEDVLISGVDDGVQVDQGKAILRNVAVERPYRHCVTIGTRSTESVLDQCRLQLEGGANAGDCVRVDGGSGIALSGLRILNCHLFAFTSGAGTHRGVALLNNGANAYTATRIHDNIFASLDTGVLVESNHVRTSIIGNDFGTDVTTPIDDQAPQSTGIIGNTGV